MKIKIREEFRVIVVPEEPLFLDNRGLAKTDKDIAKWSDACKGIIEEIKRHVDGYVDVYQDSDSREICSFCELDWEEEESGQPVCCGKAVEEWEKANQGGKQK